MIQPERRHTSPAEHQPQSFPGFFERRFFRISAQVAQSEPKPIIDSIATTKAVLDVAREFVSAQLPGYECIPVARPFGSHVWRVEAINHSRQLGAAIWLTQIEESNA
ncbi:hypothetical protein [Burkholderia gladioli]|uniref:hypothetical protein n=1 Tax=Burkholderia gladioli TaxID=28095 RepID=UPI0016400550|nr:hypothetical protein [Burkholderia gladioli]